MSKEVEKSEPVDTELNASSSRSTVVQPDSNEQDNRLKPDTQLHGGEGESAFPEDKKLEALERLEHDWAHDPANPRNWSFWKKWRMAAIVCFS